MTTPFIATRWTWRAGRGARSWGLLFTFAAVTCGASGVTWADDVSFEPSSVEPSSVEATSPSRSPVASAEPGRFLPGAIVPEASGATVFGLGWSGYDGATRAPLFGATAEARLASHALISVNAIYTSASDATPAAVRPSLTLRMPLLDQQRHGIDAAVAISYHQDRFTGEDGFFQGTVALGARSEAGTLLLNLGYGQDGEGDDHEAELRLAGLRRLREHFHLGLDAHLRKSIGSTDPRRTQHGTPSFDYLAGPVATYAVGPWSLVVETGASGVVVDRFRSGLTALGGLGALF